MSDDCVITTVVHPFVDQGIQKAVLSLAPILHLSTTSLTTIYKVHPSVQILIYIMALGGAILRITATGLRILEFGCAAIVLGIFSYFLAVLSKHNISIPTWEKAVEGMAGAAVLYTIFGIIFTLFLGGKSFFGFLAIILDILFAACFAVIAYYTRHGANKCRGIVSTPIGTGLDNQAAPGAGNYGYACSLNTACFAISILAIFLFLVSAAFNFLLVRHHKKEKRYGPSPSNNYTKGTRKPFWKRNKATKGTRDAELATAGTTHHPRVSHETGMTGSTMNNGYHAQTTPGAKYGEPGYGQGHYSTNY